jgi:hypothetical protein
MVIAIRIDEAGSLESAIAAADAALEAAAHSTTTPAHARPPHLVRPGRRWLDREPA